MWPKMPGPKECTKSPKSIGRRLVSKAGENSQPSAASHSPAVPRVAALSVPIQEKSLNTSSSTQSPVIIARTGRSPRTSHSLHSVGESHSARPRAVGCPGGDGVLTNEQIGPPRSVLSLTPHNTISIILGSHPQAISFDDTRTCCRFPEGRLVDKKLPPGRVHER